MIDERHTSIRLKQSTAQRLKYMGRKGESYDDIIVWLLKNSKKRKMPKFKDNGVLPTETRDVQTS